MSIEFDTFTMSGMNQARLLAAIYRDEKLYLSAKRIGLKAGDFALKSCATLYGILENYRSKYGKMPSMATLQDLVISKMHEDGDDTEEDAREMCSVLNELVAETVLDYRYACDKLVEFTRAARVGQQIAADPNDTNAIIAAAQEAAMVRLEDLDGGEGKGRQVSLLEDGLALLPQKKAERDMKIPTGVTWLDFVTNGGLSVTNNEIGVGMAGTGVGKALPNNDPIPTPQGWKKVGDIREGDFLFGANGKPVKVLKVHPQPEKKTIWIVKFSDGRKIRCCEDHLWEVRPDGKKKRVLSTKEIAEILDENPLRVVVAPRSKAVEYRDNGTTERDAYMEGSRQTPMSDINVREFLTAPIKVRKALLDGLVHSEVCMTEDPDGKAEFELSVWDRDRAAAILELCRSLGLSVNCTRYLYGLPMEIVDDPRSSPYGRFSIVVKTKRPAPVCVTDVCKDSRKVKMTCFTVDVKDGLFLCDKYVVTHNTNMMINFAISAAIAGFNVNFITLELTKKEIVRRALGMMAHIKTSEMRLPVEEWSPKSKERLDYLIHSSLRSRIRISDMSDKSYSVSDLVGEIERWKRETKEATGDDSKCRLVIIDWLDMLVPEAKDAKMINQQWQALQKVMEDVKHMANNQDVAVWTVMQTNRQGSGTNKVRLDHVSGAFSKNFFAALVIGLAPTGDEDDDDIISQDLTDGDLKGKLNTECDRTLHMNIIKNRDGVQREADIYQGPTLRFWRSKSDWLTTAKFLESGDMKKIFGKELKK